MIFYPDAKSLTLLFFVLHELVLAFILLWKGTKEGIAADRWLALLILLCAMYMTPWMLGKAGWYAAPGYREVLLFIPFHQYLLFGPVMYFFTRALTGERIQLNKKEWIHFLPAGLYILYSAVVAITDLLILDKFYFYDDGLDKDFKPMYQITGLISMVGYAVFCIRKHLEFKRRIYQTVSFADSTRYRWLRNFLFSLIVIIFLRAVFIVAIPEIGDWGFKWWYYLMFGLISYYLSLTGLMSSLRLSAQEQKALTVPPIEKHAPRELDAQSMNLLLEKVHMLFQESKLYADPSLSLQHLAKAVDSNTSILSRAINEKAKMNFNDFVNSYRISAVKRSLAEGEMDHKTLVGIGMDHGFNSKSTFIRSFKKKEGVTPSEYAKKLTDAKLSS